MENNAAENAGSTSIRAVQTRAASPAQPEPLAPPKQAAAASAPAQTPLVESGGLGADLLFCAAIAALVFVVLPWGISAIFGG